MLKSPEKSVMLKPERTVGRIMKNDTRNEILNAALALFLSHGYTAASIRLIAEKAGIGKATIYHHFPDKKAIINALNRKSRESMESFLDQLPAGQDPEQRIRTVIMKSVRVLHEFTDLFQIIRREVPEIWKEMKSDMGFFFGKFRNFIVQAVKDGIRLGIFRKTDPEETGLIIMKMIQGNFAFTLLGGSPGENPEKTADRMMSILLEGIRNSK